MREKLFSVKLSDLKMEVFRAGGKGGQKQNKTNSGVRLRHPESGAVGESREHASQLQNKKTAFARLADSAEMQAWIRKRSAEMMMSLDEKKAAEKRISDTVDEMTRDDYLVYEVHDENGEWVEVDHADILDQP